MEFICKICNKQYKSYQSLWNHNKRYHTNSVIHSDTLVENGDTSVIPNNIIQNTKQTLVCKYCNRYFNFRNNRWKHEKICKKRDIKQEINSNIELKILQETTKQKELELQLAKENNIRIKEEAKILKLKIKQQTKENETPTISKINNIIINININTDNANQMNPGIYEIQKPIELQKVLSPSRMKYIAKQGYGSLESYIEFLHCGKINQFKNIIITNLKNDIIYVFDSKTCQYIADVKRKVIKSLIENRMSDIENILGLISNEIDDKTKKVIKNFIREMQDNKKFINDGIAYENYCDYMTDRIILLLYNNHKKVLTDISTHIEKMAIQDKPTIEEI